MHGDGLESPLGLIEAESARRSLSPPCNDVPLMTSLIIAERTVDLARIRQGLRKLRLIVLPSVEIDA